MYVVAIVSIFAWFAQANHLQINQCPYVEDKTTMVAVGDPCGQMGSISLICSSGYCKDMTCASVLAKGQECDVLNQPQQTWCAGDTLTAPNFCKLSTSSGAYECTSRFNPGDRCQADIECKSNICGVDNTCVGAGSLKVGTVCNNNMACQNMNCVKAPLVAGEQPATKCLDPAATGSACRESEDAACKSGYCAVSECAAQLENGQTCSRDAMCLSGFCFSLTPEVVGTMKCYAKLDDGQPCSNITAIGCDSGFCVTSMGECSTNGNMTSCVPNYKNGGCTDGQLCLPTTPGSIEPAMEPMNYMCLTPMKSGEACVKFYPDDPISVEGNCDGTSYCLNGVCNTKLDNGGICTLNGFRKHAMCDSGHCGPEGTCAAKLKIGQECNPMEMTCEDNAYCPSGVATPKCVAAGREFDFCNWEMYQGWDCRQGLHCDYEGSSRCLRDLNLEQDCWTSNSCQSGYCKQMNTEGMCTQCAEFFQSFKSAGVSLSPQISLVLISAVLLLGYAALSDRVIIGSNV